jgi:DNA-binding NtrC family response regulator
MNERTVSNSYELRSPPSSPGAKPGVLMVFQRQACAPAPHRVDRPRTFGRVDVADVALDDPGVSRRHALLEPAPGGLLVTDLGSHNGTFVDGGRITDPKTFAAFGAVLRMAKTLFVAAEDVVAQEMAGTRIVPPLVGGASLSDARRLIATLAPSNTPVLIEGETGTGKEVVARAIHDASARRGEFVAVNCAALAPQLVESELFGHSRGAFSGAAGSREGLFRTADGGTLLLDEVGELPAALQAKLLRVIETGEVRAIGEDSTTVVSVRILAATNRSLDQMVAAGGFRADLFHRMAAARIHLPALRDRMEDVPCLAASFLQDEGVTIGAAAVEAALLRPWPGNVRELRNAMLVAAATARSAGRDRIVAEDLGAIPPDTGGESSFKARVAEALAMHDGNVTRAARALGIARSGLYEALRRLRLNPASYRRR